MVSESATARAASCLREFQSRTEQQRQSDVSPVVRIDGFTAARDVLRSPSVRQAGFNAELVARFIGRRHAPVLYQDGEPHQRQRSATARFFAPRVVATRYRELIERTSRDLIDRFRVAGRARLDDMSLELAVAVAADIVGLTDSPRDRMAVRLNRFFSAPPRDGGLRAMLRQVLLGQYRMLSFYWFDVRPAIQARRRDPREDEISHLIGQSYSNREILTECLTYGAAGMATTREFIVMAAWRLLEHDDLKTRFLATDEPERMTILEEVLRLEPVVSVLKRRAEREIALDTESGPVVIPAQSLVEIDVAAANRDTAATGPCPHQLDPDRTRPAKVSASVMSFGDGPHRCPGASVALHEAAIFLDQLLRVPGLRLERPPTVSINPVSTGYELRDAVIVADAAFGTPHGRAER
ncbi:putative cytochrome P450 [Bradyrhizobium sp. STM 3843]|uniref:cytochrome P450 n=1 Tax=Bradyrhizobium sp. STM 3843 TaxID=551947 RepID=UPI000240B0EC|nr:cytochrome P450 [Bradyrhizobium sp. STM 3843]CCE07562.1 putative cytochrome P450 [Bradyrhizobium sp. STM 3843]